MKAQIHIQRQLQLLRHHKAWINSPNHPIQSADETLQGRGADAEDVLDPEEQRRAGEVGDQAGEEGEEGDEQADDGQVLEVPAVAAGDGVGVLEEPVEGVEEGG
jgi:hypothetical protein